MGIRFLYAVEIICIDILLIIALIAIHPMAQAHPVDDVDNMTQAQIETLTQDCLSDYVLDWHDKRCDFLRPVGGQEEE